MRTRHFFWASTAILMTVSVVLGAWIVGTGRRGPARVEVDRLAHNWGNVVPSSRLTTSFLIRNGGGKQLLFGDVKASCGCAAPALPVRSLSPGGDVALNVEVYAAAEVGNKLVMITIPTNDPDRPEIALQLYYRSWLGIQAKPQVVEFGRMRPGDLADKSLQVFAADGKPFRIVRTDCSSPEIQVLVDGGAVPRPVHRIRVTLKAGEREGHIRDNLTVGTDLEDTPRIVIPMLAHVVGVITVTPTSLEIGSDEIGKIVQRRLLLRFEEANQLLRLDNVRSSPPLELLRYTRHSMNERLSSLDLSLRYSDGGDSSSLELLLDLGGPHPCSLRLPVVVHGRSRPLALPRDSGRCAGSDSNQRREAL